MPTETARSRLRAAIAASEAADAKIAKASEASSRARAFSLHEEASLDKLRAAGRQTSAELAADLAAEIRGGRSPHLVASPETDATLRAIAGAEHRLAVARQALAALEGEAREAAKIAGDAKISLGEAVRRVLVEEAEKIAEQVAELIAKTEPLAVALGPSLGGFLAHLPVTLSPTARAIIARNDASTMSDHNSRLGRAGSAASASWREFASALITDPDAELSFPEVPPETPRPRVDIVSRGLIEVNAEAQRAALARAS